MLKQLQNIWQAGKMEIPSGCLICDCQRDLWGFFLPEFFPEAWFKEPFKNMLTPKHIPSLGNLEELCIIIKYMFWSLIGRTLVCKGHFLTLKGWKGHPALV